MGDVSRTLADGLWTGRLRLSPVREHHEASFIRLYGDPDVMAIRKLGVCDPVQARGEFARLLAHWRDHGFGMFAVTESGRGGFVGECGLRWLEDGSDVELSYGYLPGFWGSGFATEAATATLATGMVALGLRRIIAFSRGDNERSHRVLEKAGMRFESRADRGPFGVVRYCYTGQQP